MTEVEKLFNLERRVILKVIGCFEEEIKGLSKNSISGDTLENLMKEKEKNSEIERENEALKEQIRNLKEAFGIKLRELEAAQLQTAFVPKTEDSKSIADRVIAFNTAIETEYGSFKPIDALYMYFDGAEMKKAFGVDCHMPEAIQPINLLGYEDGEFKFRFSIAETLQIDKDERVRIQEALHDLGWQGTDGVYSIEEGIVTNIVPVSKLARVETDGNS